MSTPPQPAQEAVDPRVLRLADLGVAALLIAIAVAVFIVSADFPKPRSGPDIGAAGFPRFYAVMLILLGGILGFKALRRPVPATATPPSPGVTRARMRVAAGVAISVACFVVMQYVGFIPASALQLVALMILMGRHNLGQTLAIAAALTAAVYLLFSYALNVPLPVGSLFE